MPICSQCGKNKKEVEFPTYLGRGAVLLVRNPCRECSDRYRTKKPRHSNNSETESSPAQLRPASP